jgi:hypothetical protein
MARAIFWRSSAAEQPAEFGEVKRRSPPAQDARPAPTSAASETKLLGEGPWRITAALASPGKTLGLAGRPAADPLRPAAENGPVPSGTTYRKFH